MNEMQADVERARIEADLEKARLEVERQEKATEGAKWKAEAEKTSLRRAKLFDRESLLVAIGLVVFMVLTIGGFIGQHMYHSYNYNKTVSQCQESGGTWTTKVQEATSGRGEKYSVVYEICDREVPYP